MRDLRLIINGKTENAPEGTTVAGLLARMGICYTPLGPMVMHHGVRQPCYCYLPDMLENARRVHPECWEVLTDGGVLHDQLLTNARISAVA